MADLFEETTKICGKPKKVSNWLMGETMRLLKENSMEAEEICFAPEHLAALIELVDAGTINGSVAKEVFEEMFRSDIDPEKYVEEKGLKVVNDEGALRETIEKVIADNPQSVEDYHNGKKESHGIFGWPDDEGYERKSKSGYGKCNSPGTSCLGWFKKKLEENSNAGTTDFLSA